MGEDGHLGLINAVCFTPDSQHVVTASEDATVKVWNVSTGKCSLTLKGHTKAVRTLAVMPDGSKAVSAGTDGTLRVWDLMSGACLQTLGRKMGQTWALKSLGDGRRVVTGSMDKLLRLWDLSTPSVVQIIGKHPAEVRSLEVMPDGKNIVVGIMENDECNDIRVFDCSQPVAPVHSWTGHDSSISALALLPRKRIISGGFDMTVRIWNWESSEPELVTDSQGAFPWSIASWKDGRGFAVGYESGDFRVWDLKHNLEALSVPARHPYGVFGVDVSPDGRLVASVGGDRILKVLKVEE